MAILYTEAMKTVLITGASSGIGAATAKLLHQEGYKVYGAARQIERMTALTDLGIQVVVMDVTSDASMKKAVSQIGRVDVLINNAGYGEEGAFEDVSMEKARKQLDVNLFGMARLTQLVIPQMRKRKEGTIINIGSMAGKFATSYGSWYHISKYAVEALTDSLAQELKPFGIKVVVIEPGAIKTKWWDIAADNMLKTSGQGPYKSDIKRKVAYFRTINNRKFASSPEKVAKKIAKVIKIENPRYRYAIGGGARPLLYLRRILTDKMFYRIMGS